MEQRIYNTLTKQKEKFVPLKAGEVSIYVCGPTVYDFLHVGNFRGPVVFNMIRNWFEASGFKVTYVSNFTDIDDRIIDRALKEKVDSLVISERYIDEYRRDYATLGLRPQSANPKVTEHLAGIISMIEKLIERGKAYVAEDGEVLYAVRSFEGYGKLSKRDIDDLRSGSRIQPGEKKRDPLDFALWKPAKPGEPSWPSPWGAGRPGWHIECSAMVAALFGEQIDIHGGGMDLIFPHHENEVAQSEGSFGKDFVKYWVHWNMINFGDKKMSKSIGNVRTAREFLSSYEAEIYKWMILSVHYRSVSDFSEDGIERAVAGLARVYSALAAVDRVIAGGSGLLASSKAPMESVIHAADEKARAAMSDDFNTPEVFAELFNVVRAFNASLKPGKVTPDGLENAMKVRQFFQVWGELLSLFEQPAEAFLRKLDDMLLKQKGIERSAIDAKVAERRAFRDAKNWAESDRLRDELVQMGIALQDTAEGSRWEVAK
jgi:cysteinyl-tRNA synthetase